jgi:ParE toxin of type II toxin-antitoxin system, parDE
MFTVKWTHRALDQLAELYVAADLPTQDRLARLIDALNHRLAADPLNEGESRTDNYRVSFVDGLVVRFTVDSTASVVRVYAIRGRRN